MGFPEQQLPLYVGIAPGADPADPAGWGFTEITSDVRTDDGVEIALGRPDEGTRVDATRTRAKVDNSSGDYSRVNPLGQWYGQLDKGTPVEYRVCRVADSFTRPVGSGLGTDADSGLTWTTGTGWSADGSAAQAAVAAANNATLAVLGGAAGDDVEVSTVAALSAVTTGANWVHAIVLRHSDSTHYYLMHTEFTTDGVIAAKIMKRSGGTLFELAALTATTVGYGPGTLIRTRARAVGSTLQVRVWADGDPEPSVWHATAQDSDHTGQGVGLYEWRVAGNSNAGTLTCTVDDFTMWAIRASTPVPEWPVRWDMSGNDVTAPIVGAGTLRRLSQGAAVLRSPIYRQLVAQPGCAYWPLEDGSDSGQGAPALPRGIPASVADGSFGSTDCPPGASSALALHSASTSRVRGRVDRWTVAQDGYAVMFYLKLGSLPGGSGLDFLEISAAGTVARWLIQVANGSITVNGYNSAGTQTVGPSANAHSLTLTDWWAFQLEAEESGGTVTWSAIWHQVGSTSFAAASDTYAGSADRVWSATVIAPVASTLVSNLWIGDDALAFVDTTFMKVSAGYAGERAGERLERLATEHGVPLRIFGDPAETTPMGAQRPGTFLDAARECEDADQGVLIEAGGGLGYLTRRFRENPEVALALDFAQGQVAAPPEPTDDDQRLRNQIKLSRTGGSEITVQDDVSIAKSGIYSDELAVNVQADGQLEDHAFWRLHLGTQDGLRWPRIELDLARNPDLIADWCTVRIGSRITIANPPPAVGTDDLDLIVEGWTETLGSHSWRVVLTCSPAAPWRVGVFDAATSLADSASTALQGEVGSSATSLRLRTWNPLEVWSETNEPFDVAIAGERVTVTAMSAADHNAELISGAFESLDDIAAWGVNADCTLARSSTFAHGGSFSGLMTVTGSPTQAYIRPLPVHCPRVLPGESYTHSVWVRSTAGLTTVRATIDWLDEEGGYLSTNDSGGSLSSGSWVQRSVTATAPAGAAYAQYGPTVLSSPSAGTVLYVDDATIEAATVSYQTATVTRAVNGIAKGLPAGEEVHIAPPVHFAV